VNIFFWKKNREIDAFAYQLADALYSDVLPAAADEYIAEAVTAAKGKAAKKANDLDKRVSHRLNDIITRIQQYRATRSLGVYGKARLHLTFTERLKELGYHPNTAKELNMLILLRTP